MKKKRKKSFVGYVLKDWYLLRSGIGICHSVVWIKKGAESKTKIRITIEEI